MANSFQNPVIYTNECLRVLKNVIVLGGNVNRDHEKEFGKNGMKIGDTINIRRPARYQVVVGAGFSPQDYTETSIPLVVNQQKHVDTAFTSADLTLRMQDYSDREIKPKMIQLAQQIDADGYVNAKNTVGNLTGTAGTAPNNISFITDLGRKLDDFSVPRDGKRYAVLDQASTASMVNSLSGFFNAQKEVSEQYREALFMDGTNTIGLKLAMSQNVARHTVGPLGGAPTVNGAGQGLTSGWSNIGFLITNNWTAAAAPRVNAGDIFTVAGLTSVNPVTRQSTNQLMQFVCIANQSSDAAGNLTLQISPAIITAGPFQNVVAAPTSGNALTFVGSANTGYVRNMSWHFDAFAFACVPMIDLAFAGGWGAVQKQDGFALRIFRQAAISTDTVGCRVDALYGWATPYPEQASQQVGA